MLIKRTITAQTVAAIVVFSMMLVGSAFADCINLEYIKNGGSRIRVTFQVFNDGDGVMLFARQTETRYLNRGERATIRACNNSMQGDWLYKALIKINSTSTSWEAARTVANLPINSTVVCTETDNQFGCHRQ